MNGQSKENDMKWVECPAGLIQQAANSASLECASRSTNKLDRRQVITAAATAAGIAVIGGVWYASKKEDGVAPSFQGGGQMASKNYGGINCVEVAQLLPVYISNTIEDEAKIAKMKQHLEMCETCRETYEYQLQS